MEHNNQDNQDNQDNQYYTTIINFIEREYINNFPLELHNQIKYLFTDGKKIRPILCLAFANYSSKMAMAMARISNEVEENIILTICCTIELIHCISLVIDDLPELDNDDIRRDKPAFHIKYGIEYTNFFIYYILNKSITILNNLNAIIDNTDLNLDIKYARDILYLFKFNLDNLVDGQYIDMEYSTQECNISTTLISENTLDLHNLICDIIFTFLYDICNQIDCNTEDLLYQNIMLNIKKTGTLFSLSTSIGHLLNLWSSRINYTGREYITDISKLSILEEIDKDGKVRKDRHNENIRYDGKTDRFFNIIAVWGNILGYVFQISDDILDYEIDKAKNKPNICNILGCEKTVKLFELCCDWLKNTLDIINTNSVRLWGTQANFNNEVINKIVEKIQNRIC